MNRQGAAAGNPLEAKAIAAGDFYSHKGIGKIYKIGIKTVFARPGLYRGIGKSGPDFVGAYRGIPVAFECKSTKSKTWAWSQCTPEQKRWLIESSHCGEAGVLFEIDGVVGWYRITPDEKFDVSMRPSRLVVAIPMHVLGGGPWTFGGPANCGVDWGEAMMVASGRADGGSSPSVRLATK